VIVKISETKTSGQADSVYEGLRIDVLAGRLRPGAKLLMRALCSRFGVSLGAVREALAMLAAEGLVLSSPQRGFTVAPISKSDLQDLTAARAEIEALCIVKAIENGDLEWETKIVASHYRLARKTSEAHEDIRQRDDWSVLHGDFHAALADGCGSRWLLRLRSILYEHSERYRRLSFPINDDDRDIVTEHDELCKAVLARDTDRAVKLIKAQVNTTAATILEHLPDEPAGPQGA
jgi:DNA-binding GntR family transcriptional regulator